MSENTNTSSGQQTSPGLDTPEGIAALGAALADAMRQKATETLSGLAAEAVPLVTDKTSLLSRLTPRMLVCLVLAAVLVAAVALLSPQQLPVAAYKLALVTIAGYLGYWLDRWCFPYARPDSFLTSSDWRADKQPVDDRANHPVAEGCEQIYAAAMLRRSLVMLGTMLALGLGL